MGQLTHIKKHIGALMGKLGEKVLEKCKCSMTIRVLGDGCPVCQPETWARMLQEQLDECRDGWREDIAMEMRHNIMIDIDAFPSDWDMLADYFTHE